MGVQVLPWGQHLPPARHQDVVVGPDGMISGWHAGP